MTFFFVQSRTWQLVSRVQVKSYARKRVIAANMLCCYARCCGRIIFQHGCVLASFTSKNMAKSKVIQPLIRHMIRRRRRRRARRYKVNDTVFAHASAICWLWLWLWLSLSEWQWVQMAVRWQEMHTVAWPAILDGTCGLKRSLTVYIGRFQVHVCSAYYFLFSHC